MPLSPCKLLCDVSSGVTCLVRRLWLFNEANLTYHIPYMTYTSLESVVSLPQEIHKIYLWFFHEK